MTPMMINLVENIFFPLVNRPAKSVFAPLEVAIPAVKKVNMRDCQDVNNSPFFILIPVI